MCFVRLTALLLAASRILFAANAMAQIDTAILRPVGYHPSHIAYYNAPYFANALYQGGEWFAFTGFEHGTQIDFNARPTQFINGYPQFLEPNQKLRAVLFGLNIESSYRPATWPSRGALAKGRIVMTWQGNADVRLANCAFIAADSNGGETGLINHGRRVYLCTDPLRTLEVHAIQTPITDLKVWLAHNNQSLEGQLFHPLFIERIFDRDWAFLRFMDWGATNASPQQNWSDRRRPSHIFMNGIITARAPAAGSDPNRETGVAYENMVALCNATGQNLWINIPHLATDEYITKLAQLIRFGSNGSEPYTSANPNAEFPPLHPGLKVYVEFSNEIWSNGFAFPQGNWAQDQAIAAGLAANQNDLAGRARFNARKFCDAWQIFQTVFGRASRLVRVAAIFTANTTYSEAFLREMGTYGTGRTPAVRPDVLAVTTYFGNGIQDYVKDAGFTTGKLFNDPYWTSASFENDRAKTFREWTRRILAGDATTGAGPDATAIGGGFSSSLRDLPQSTLGYRLPIIAYEGGPSLFTDNIDQNAQNGSGVPTDDHVTTFIEAMNRDRRIADVYSIHLEIAKSKGLWTHTPYTDTSTWGRFGQWGHLETLDADLGGSPKYKLILEYFSRHMGIRNIDVPLGQVPSFTTSASLPVGIYGQSYSQDIGTTGGTGPRILEVIGAFFEPGLHWGHWGGLFEQSLHISGTPTGSGKNFLFARVSDADGDAAWRIFTLETFGGPGTLVQSDFRGTNPAQNRPWTQTFARASSVTWSGWSVGSGIVPQNGNDAFFFSVSGTQTDPGSTLASAIADREYLTATVTPASGPLDLRGAEFRFRIRRVGDHSPRAYAVFAGATELYVSDAVAPFDKDETEHVVTLPSTAAFSAITTPLEFRIYAFGAKFDGHATSLTAFQLIADVPSPKWPRRRGVRH